MPKALANCLREAPQLLRPRSTSSTSVIMIGMPPFPRLPAAAKPSVAKSSWPLLILMVALVALQPGSDRSKGASAAEASRVRDRQSAVSLQEPTAEGTNGEDDVPTDLRIVLESVKGPEVGALAKALGTEPDAGNAMSRPSANSLKELGDLDGDGIPELALKWFLREPGGQSLQEPATPRLSWGLFLLAWDGRRWRATRLAVAGEDLQFQVVRLGEHGRRGIAVVTVDEETAVPYPAVFEVKQHAATLLWDGEADESRYQGYQHGQIEFRDVGGQDSTAMIVTGRADPGLLVFQKGGRRGFTARALYRWDGQAFVPSETQYSANPDYALYRFVSALHLHEFRAAYALIDSARFLKTDAPTLDKFRRLIEDSWPEFLDDRVFEAREGSTSSLDQYALELPEKHYVYRPTFSGDGRCLLTGLERREEAVPTEPSVTAP
jgi:hypothetical protein